MFFKFEKDGEYMHIDLEDIVSFNSKCVKRLYEASISKDYDFSSLENLYVNMSDGEVVYSSKVKAAKKVNSLIANLKDVQEVLDYDYSNTNKLCFKFKDSITQKESAIVVALSYFCKKYEIRKEKFISFDILEDDDNNSDIIIVEMDPNGYRVSYADQLTKYLNYYEDQIKKVDEMKQTANIQIDLDMLRVYRNEFSEIVKDDKDILIPLKNKYTRLKSFKFDFFTEKKSKNEKDNIAEYSQHIIECPMQNCLMRKISGEDLVSYLNAFEEVYNINLPENTRLLLITCDEDKQKEEVFKHLFDANTIGCNISYDIAGEITRLKRIKIAIDDILSENVANKNIAEIISTGKSLKNLNNYKKDEKYCKELVKRNPILDGNEEQITTIDKIMQMNANGTDILLVQGPPGTGKTELITALCNEFDVSNQTVLVSSNVQIACNNISERIKNNKEMILKRYENVIGNEKYDMEVLKNKKNYVINQTFNKYKIKNKSVLTKEDLEEEKEILASEIQARDSLIEENKQLQLTLEKYLSLLSQREELDVKNENDIINRNSFKNQLEILKNELIVITLKMVQIKKELEGEEKKLIKIDKDLNSELSKQTELAELKQKIENEIKLLNENQKKIEEYLARQNELDKDFNNSIQRCQKELREASLITKDVIFTEILEYITKPKIIPGKLLAINQEIKNILFSFKLLRNQLIQDQNLIEGNKFVPSKNTCNILKREFSDLYFEKTSERKAFEIFIKYHTELTFLDKVLIKIFNKNVKNISRDQINSATEEVAFICNRLLKNLEKCIENIVNKYFSEEKIENFKAIKVAEEKKANDNYAEFLLIVKNGKKQIHEIKEQIKQNKKDLSICNIEEEQVALKIEKTNALLDKQKEILEKLNQRFGALEKEKTSLLEEISEKEKEMSEVERLINENSNNFEVIERKLEQEKLLHSNEIDKFEEFKISYDQKLKEYEKTINEKQQPISFIEECISSVGEEIAFDYFKELESIEKIKDEKLDSLKKYFDGYIDSFDAEFRIDGENWKGSTISMTTSQIAKLFRNNNDVVFDYAVIDEASKCSFEDLSIILPKIKKLVLIGDYMQLEPIFDDFSELDEKTQNIFEKDESIWVDLNRSSFNLLLSQLIENNEQNNIQGFEKSNCVGVMKKQFRMNKGIFNIVSPIYSIHKGFEIIDMKKTSARDVLCFDVDGHEESLSKDSDASKYNEEEIDFIKEILEYIQENQKELSSIQSIGIITGYADQVRKLKTTMAKAFPKGSFKNKRIECGTFDRFQGREYDLVIVSMVRTEKLGFLREIRRMNVAMSRAKKHLIIIGNFEKIKEIAKKHKTNENITNQTKKEEKFVCETLVPMLANLCKEIPSSEEKIAEINKAILGR